MWFWSSQFKASFYKKILIIVAFSLCAFILWMGIMEYSTRLLKDQMPRVEKILKTEIGFPIKYASIEPRWRLGSIFLSLKDVVIIDNEVPIAFLSAKSLQLETNPYRLIFKQEQPFNRLDIDGLKMVLGWDNEKHKELTVLGLKGEWFPSSFDYQSLLKALSNQELLRFRNSEILWLGPSLSITQKIDGKFSWEDVKNRSWQFVGKQQVKVHKKEWLKESEFLPVSFFNVQMNTPLQQLNLKFGIERTRLEMKLNFPKDGQEPIYLESILEGRDIDLRALHQNVQLTEDDPDWLRWVIESIERGSLTRGKVYILGPINNLDWHGEIDFNNINLLYNKNWPRIRKADGKVLIEKENVRVQLYSGNILGSKIKRVDALIEPIGQADRPILKVEGTVSGRLENGIKFLLLSPLKKSLGEHLSHLKPSGWMDLHLNLRIPLGAERVLPKEKMEKLEKEEFAKRNRSIVEVQGQVAIENGELELEALGLPMTNLNGLFRFTENGVEARGVTAELSNKPVQIEANPDRVTARLMVDSEFLKDTFDSGFLPYIKGESEMSVAYLNAGDWVIESSLQGMKIDLPYPFTKEEAASLPVALTIYPADGKEHYYALNAKGLMDAKWATETKEDVTVLKRGQVILGGAKNADWVSNNTFYIGGETPYISVEEWKSFLDKGGKGEKVASANESPEAESVEGGGLEDGSETPQAALGGETKSKTDGLKSEFAKKLPIQINLLVKELEAFGMNFNNTSIKHLTEKSEWSLDGPTIKGSMILPTRKNKQLQFFFQHLKLSSKQIDQVKSFHEGAGKPLSSFLSGKMPISFNAQNLTFDDAWFGETTFRLQPKPYGYEIQELSFRNKASRLEARGEWRIASTAETTHLMGEILSDNMSQTFTQWGFSSAMQEGKGRIQFNLQWLGSPFQFNFKKLEGAAELKLRSGHILGVNPGLGKVLGLLSLENLLTKRLQLDFSDVLKKGFVFDKLETNLKFNGGGVETDNLWIDGSAAKIKIAGRANLSSKEIDLEMWVTPKVGNTLPVVASLATGNPAIGAGVWVLDKLTGSKISDVSQKRYHVTGTWDAPQMDEIGKKKVGVGRGK